MGKSFAATAVLALALGGALAKPEPAAADPRLDYVLHCRGCHGPDGAGAPGGAPPLRDHVARFLAVPGGREYLIRVPGTARSELSDARIAALLNWMPAAFDGSHVPADFAPYTEAEVAPLRRAPLLDVAATRGRLRREIENRQTSEPRADPRRTVDGGTGSSARSP